MDTKKKFVDFLIKKNLRYTSQRQHILDVFMSTERHVTTEDLYMLVRKKYNGIGYATVFRTMKLLMQSGVCRGVDFGDAAQRYEYRHDNGHHDHLVCLNCGRFVEIFDAKLEELQRHIVKKHDYMQEYHKLDIFGLCPQCKRN